MSNKITFKWVSFTGDSEEYVGSYANTKIVINYTFPEVSLDQMVETAKYVEELKGVKVLLEGAYNDSAVISGLTDPIRLVDSFDIGDYESLYTMLGKGPTMQWLLDSKEELSNPNPSKLLYTNDIVVQFAPSDHNESVVITLLSADDSDYFSEMVEGSRIEWLGDRTFDTFLESYGYTDEDSNRDLVVVIMLYQAARALGFEDPKEVVVHFCDNRLIAGLALKGVLEDLREYPLTV